MVATHRYGNGIPKVLKAIYMECQGNLPVKNVKGFRGNFDSHRERRDPFKPAATSVGSKQRLRGKLTDSKGNLQKSLCLNEGSTR